MKGQKPDASQGCWQVEPPYVRAILKGALGKFLDTFRKKDLSQFLTPKKSTLTDTAKRRGEGNFSDFMQIAEPVVANLMHTLFHDNGFNLVA